MLFTPYQIAVHYDHLRDVSPQGREPAGGWVWIAGRRYKKGRRL
jgi:hypothetical protein